MERYEEGISLRCEKVMKEVWSKSREEFKSRGVTKVEMRRWKDGS